MEELYTKNISKKACLSNFVLFLPDQDLEKQWRYSRVTDLWEWREGLGEEDFLPADLKCLIKVDGRDVDSY